MTIRERRLPASVNTDKWTLCRQSVPSDANDNMYRKK